MTLLMPRLLVACSQNASIGTRSVMIARSSAGRVSTREAAMTKLFASEAAVKVTDEAARIFASYGLAMEYPVQRYFRDARFLLPGGGTSEILRVVIGRDLDWDRGTAFQ